MPDKDTCYYKLYACYANRFRVKIWACTNCGEEIPTQGSTRITVDYGWKYCPFCGAEIIGDNYEEEFLLSR